MSRMSVALTLDAVRTRTKTETRRDSGTWRNLKPGERVTLIEKGMGLPKGAKQIVVAEVEIVSVQVQPLGWITQAQVTAEGFDMTPDEFIRFWLDNHGHKQLHIDIGRAINVRRIEWRYLPCTCVCHRLADGLGMVHKDNCCPHPGVQRHRLPEVP